MLDMITVDNIVRILRILLDIALIWMVFYFALRLIRNNTRTIQIFKGIMFLLIAKELANVLGLVSVSYLLNLFVGWGFIAIIVVFQPEIRNILEKLGTTDVFSRLSSLSLNEREKLVRELVKACSEMSKTKTGALISIEQKNSLAEYVTTGTPLNSEVSSDLLCTIFQYGTPLHDGAVIIKGTKIASAAVYFPPTTRELPTEYGARHRAAVGISEVADCITIVVSEESGRISVSEGGKLTSMDVKGLHDFLMERIEKKNVTLERVAVDKGPIQEETQVEVEKLVKSDVVDEADSLSEDGKVVPLDIHYKAKNGKKAGDQHAKK